MAKRLYSVLSRLAALSTVLIQCGESATEGFLVGPRHRHTGGDEDFQTAMRTVMGCGGDIARDRLLVVEKALLPMWVVLQKNSNGLVDWRMVRYIAHRYFMRKSSIMIRGFEPMRHVNTSDLGTAEILGKRVPSLVEKDLHSKQSAIGGYSLNDTVAMIATLEQLISDDERSLLENVYARQRKHPETNLNVDDFVKLLESYTVHWLMNNDEVAERLLAKPSKLNKIPKWQEIRHFVSGEIDNLRYSHRQSAKVGDAKLVLMGTFSFENAHEVASSITTKFASFWESECQHIKESLVALDRGSIGRVRLADFYGANADGEWRFAESETYLRELGALDETSRWRGKQVIISNYLQGANNCIASTPHYLVCCINECEEVLNEIEDAVGAPLAPPDKVLFLVDGFTGLDDQRPKVDEVLKMQLMRIAETHGGQVPLHGRLFSQWLHYVFPRECPFPHKAGTVISSTPKQFGDQSLASHVEVGQHAAAREENASLALQYEEAQLMAQWSEEEDLVADYSSLRVPWASTPVAHRMMIGVVVFAVLRSIAVRHGGSQKGDPCGFFEKAHFV